MIATRKTRGLLLSPVSFLCLYIGKGDKMKGDMKMVIDKEFAELIPPLTSEEYKRLERSILADGCRDALVVWGDTLVDGHNRYHICTEHNIPYTTVNKEFDDRNAAMLWMLQNQLSRRNLNDFQRVEMVRKYEKAVKAQAEQRMLAGKSNPMVNLSKGTSRDTLGAMAGVSGSTYEHATAVLDKAPEEVIQAVRKGDISINKAYTDMKKAEHKAERQEAIAEQLSKPKTSSHVDIFTTDKKYRVIYADPPWSYNDKQDTSYHGGAVKHYPTMPLEEICALPIPAEKDAVLFLWTTSPMLEDSFKVIKAWGFKYKSSFIWDKISTAMGNYNSVRHEFLLICVRGNCVPDVPKRLDSVVSIKRTTHSRKPDEFRQMIDTLYPVGERLEMFAREVHEGWDVWGNMS